LNTFCTFLYLANYKNIVNRPSEVGVGARAPGELQYGGIDERIAGEAERLRGLLPPILVTFSRRANHQDCQQDDPPTSLDEVKHMVSTAFPGVSPPATCRCGAKNRLRSPVREYPEALPPPADARIDVALVRALLSEQHPQLARLRLLEHAEGWDNRLFRLGGDLVVRLPRRAWSRPG
jgi:hypothetical protein